VKKEKNMKEKVRATETGNQSSSSVDDQGKSSVDASRNEKSKDGSVSSEPASGKHHVPPHSMLYPCTSMRLDFS